MSTKYGEDNQGHLCGGMGTARPASLPRVPIYDCDEMLWRPLIRSGRGDLWRSGQDKVLADFVWWLGMTTVFP